MVKLAEPQVIRCVGASMSVRFKKPHAAFKHRAYSATAVLPGEDEDAFRELHQKIIAELAPVGALEEDLVGTIARLLWRKQNLAILRIVEFAREHGVEFQAERPFFAWSVYSIRPGKSWARITSWLKSAKQRPLIACWRIYRLRKNWMRQLISV